MGADLYLEHIHHNEENFGPLMGAVEKAIKLLQEEKPKQALLVLKRAKKKYTFGEGW